MDSKTVVMAITFAIGLILGYSLTSGHYKDLMLEEAEDYKKQVEKAKAKEEKWKQEANRIDNEYKQKIVSIQSNNDELINRLRKQLQASSRMPSNCNSSVQSNGDPRGARVSEEVNNIIEFSGQCAQRADELIIQLDSLQNWIKSVK